MKFGWSVGEGLERLALLTKAPLERLAPHAQACHYPKGSRICDGFGLSEAAYFILSGSCELRAGSFEGVGEALKTLGPGGVFGALGEAQDNQVSATAASDSVLLRIERSHLELLRTDRNASDAQRGAIEVTLSSESRQNSGRGRVVTLTFLSEEVPASLISEQLARWLHAETAATVMLVRLEEGDNKIPDSTPVLNGEFHMPSRVVRAEGGYHFLSIAIGCGGPSVPGVASLVDLLSSHFKYVLIETPPVRQAAQWLIELLVRSDWSYAFLGPSNEDIAHLELIVRETRARADNSEVRLKPIGCLGEGRLIDGFDLHAERVAGPMHMFVHSCPMRGSTVLTGPGTIPAGSFNNDVRRLAREIGGRLVGLALSSGAAKGFSHIGVIQVLEENGIEVDVVAGSSMGAYVGALWTYGLDGRELERLARELEVRWALWSLVDPVFLPRQGFLRGEALKKRLMRSIGTARFGDLQRPLRVVAGNLATLERVVFASGEVATAVHCSSAVPGICVPITLGAETYIDGAVVDPLPVDVLREMGVTRVVAVDAIPTPDRIRCKIQGQRELARQKQQRAGGIFRKTLRPDQQPSEFARGNLLQIVMRSLHGAQIRVAEASCLLADLVLRPNIYDDCWLDCAKPGKFIALGREVAERHLEEIKALTSGKPTCLEREFAAASVAKVA